jgi:uncharacterized protein YbjT (DUF2867 family)
MRTILFGASGNVGRALASELVRAGHSTTVVIRHAQMSQVFESLGCTVFVADPNDPKQLTGLCAGQEVVLSAIGKPVSPMDRSKPSFHDIDYSLNVKILNEALVNRCSEFVYISAFHAERYPDLAYFSSHHAFEKKLIEADINHHIVKPPALFCAFNDMIPMARKGLLVQFGQGNHTTNPIHEADVARIAVSSIGGPSSVIEAGGPKTYTRRELADILQSAIAPKHTVKTVPMGLVKGILPLLKFLDRNTYDKLAFITTVMEVDTIAPTLGERLFEDYFN